MTGSGSEGHAGRRQGSVFLERSTYRRRRLIDALRLLPLLGICLWAVPLLWNAQAHETPMSHAILYVFGVWLILVVAAGLMAVRVARPQEDAEHSDDTDGPMARF